MRVPVAKRVAELVQHVVQLHLQVVQQVAGLGVHLQQKIPQSFRSMQKQNPSYTKNLGFKLELWLYVRESSHAEGSVSVQTHIVTDKELGHMV